jgi:spore germination cell wall hydrolase CwlJ-like protein
MKILFLSIWLSAAYFLYSIPYEDYIIEEDLVPVSDAELNLPVRKVPPKVGLEPLFSESEVLCLQQNIFFEARNQGYEAKIAVAWVTLNRVNHSRHANDICGVVKHAIYKNGLPVKNRCAFSWFCDRKPDRPSNNKIELRAWDEAGYIARKFLMNCLDGKTELCPEDPTHGATFYFNPTLADPHWKNVKVKTVAIDDHVFYRYND